jgi:hypothetical protein
MLISYISQISCVSKEIELVVYPSGIGAGSGWTFKEVG